jgi:NAD(P)-dependent dehydrogenase (short-subunit alcohol dehydrogenase family)
MGRFDGRVVFVTGGARGQGRQHALAFAEEGADIAFCDIASQIQTVPYKMSTEDQLEETVRLVEDLDRRCLGLKADCRDTRQVNEAVETAWRSWAGSTCCSPTTGSCPSARSPR